MPEAQLLRRLFHQDSARGDDMNPPHIAKKPQPAPRPASGPPKPIPAPNLAKPSIVPVKRPVK